MPSPISGRRSQWSLPVTGSSLALVASLLSVAATWCTASAAERPDLVVFLSDDHTRTDSSLYGDGQVPTPNMDRIADAGMTFDRAFVVSPSCAPSRAALLTGLMPQHNGAEPNHSRPRADIKKLPAYLQELGYEVVSFGKVGHYAQTPEYGFDLALHFTYHDDVAVDKAIEWLQARDSDKPLCLFVGTNWPHVPWPEQSSFDPDALRIPPKHVDTPQTRRALAAYYEAVKTMDRELGKVYDAAYEKLGDDTFFLHTSDHGSQWPFGKWNLYDTGIRTPLVVTWPGRVAAKTRTDAMVTWVDLLPTLIDAAEGQAPSEIDGKSFLPVLLGEAKTHRDIVYTTHSGDGNMNVFPIRAARDSRWKYIRNLHPEFKYASHVTEKPGDTGYWPSWVEAAKTDAAAAAIVKKYTQRPAEELYDLDADRNELNNLADDPNHTEKLEEMRTKLTSWMKAMGDQEQVFGTPVLLPRPGPKPNIISILIDDMGWSDLSCFGNKETSTPQIDRLASEGVRFTQFYVNSPICSPSRTALTTGHYPARHRITSFLAHRQANLDRGMAQWLDVEAPTLARMLTGVGYASGHFGKWHMGGQRDVGEAPLITEYGFQSSLTNFEGLGHRVLPLCDAYDGKPPRKHDLGSASLGRGPIRWEDRSKITGEFVSEALRFIDQAAASDKPFFVNVWPDDVHSPFFPPQALRTDEAKRALYLAVLQAMDTQLGVLLDRVRNDEKLRNNTLILFCSDNGPEPGAGKSSDLRGNKGQLYEGGIRSPLIVWGPGLIAPSAAGSTNDTTVVSSVDLVASLRALAQAEAPAGYAGDGENLLAPLLGLSTGARSTPLFWRRPPDRPTAAGGEQGRRKKKAAVDLPDLAIRDGNWKLLCNLDGSGVELYDIANDAAEKNNVAADHRPLVRRLTKQLLTWNQSLPEDAVATGMPGE
ncbi:MAG: sulfatase-like hydrolase/transferase [Planctomycetaceae bacterium]